MYLIPLAIFAACICFVNGQTTEDCAAQMTAYPPDPRSECCGIDSRLGDKIFGGNETAVDEYPWLVVIEYEQNGHTSLGCGGALISSKYVLTAAHCVSRQVTGSIPKRVRLGEHDTSHEGEDCAPVPPDGYDCNEGAMRILIEKIIIHPEYKIKNDIALLRLAETAPFTDFIRPICLPTIDVTEQQNLPTNFTFYAAGWGAVSATRLSSNVKMHVELPYVNPEACQSIFQVPGRQIELWKGQMCAGGVEGKDSCKGDSGGPLMYVEGRSYQAIGITSFGLITCGTEGVPVVYSKVYEYLDWIKNTIVP